MHVNTYIIFKFECFKFVNGINKIHFLYLSLGTIFEMWIIMDKNNLVEGNSLSGQGAQNPFFANF